MFSLGRDLAGEIKTHYAAAATSATAGGAGDATAVNGTGIDTTALGTKYESVAFALAATATLAATKTLTLTAKIQDSSDNSTFADLVSVATVLTLTGATGGSTETGSAVVGVGLDQARQYVRVVFTPDLSASSTDTAEIVAVALFGRAAQV